MLFRKILTIVHLNSKLWNQLVPIPSSCGSSGAVRFSSRAVRLFPALLERGVRPSYGTFFHMVFQGNCARVRTGHMIIRGIFAVRFCRVQHETFLSLNMSARYLDQRESLKFIMFIRVIAGIISSRILVFPRTPAFFFAPCSLPRQNSAKIMEDPFFSLGKETREWPTVDQS